MAKTRSEGERNSQGHFPHVDIAKLVDSQEGWGENKIHQLLLSEKLTFWKLRLSLQISGVEFILCHIPLGGRSTVLSFSNWLWGLSAPQTRLHSGSTSLASSRWWLWFTDGVWFMGVTPCFSLFHGVCIFLTPLLPDIRKWLCAYLVNSLWRCF